MKKLHFIAFFLLCIGTLAAQKRSVTSITPAHIIESKSLVGFWHQVIPIRLDNGQTIIQHTGNFKVINSDKSFYTFVNWNDKRQTTVGLYGTYQITSDSTYTEHIIQSGINPSLTNTDSPLRYKFINENIIYLQYCLNGNWIPEMWKRVELEKQNQTTR